MNSPATKTVCLREVAHARSGEKGNSSMISVIAYEPQDYGLLCEQVTVDAVRKVFGPITRGSIARYEVPRIGALNFVLDEVLEGGRSRTLAFEESGKALSSLMLTLPVRVPAGYVERKDRPATEEGPRSRPSGDAAKPAGTIRLAAATAWSRDRFEPALSLVRDEAIDYLCFESMSEVTMSAAQVALNDGHATPPYDPYLLDRLRPVLAECKQRGIRIISNQGWLDPDAAAQAVQELAGELGIADLRVAAVSGGILTDRIAGLGLRFSENGQAIADLEDDIVSAEAYLGCEGIVQALQQGADVVITTRVADAALYLGPLAHEFGWDTGNSQQMARGMVVGHLMECGAQLAGGYFADPGYKDVPDLAHVGNPIADVSPERIVLRKQRGSGGLLSPATCKEQLLYEVHDPGAYIGPDCTTDFGAVSFTQIAPDTVEVHIAEGAGFPKPDTLKALVGVREGYMTEEMVIFAGPGAHQRAQLTESILRQRLASAGLQAQEMRFDYIGVNAVHREATPPSAHAPYEVVLRVAIKTSTRQQAELLRKEVDPLAVNGLYGTGKWATTASGSRVRSVIGLNSCLVPRTLVDWSVSFAEEAVHTPQETP
jgi:hypothetical protein